VDRPAMDRGMIHLEASFGHHLLKILKAEIVREIPPHAEQGHRPIKMPALEHTTLRFCTQGAVAETPEQKVCDGSLRYRKRQKRRK
jgi:hypothetical protein